MTKIDQSLISMPSPDLDNLEKSPLITIRICLQASGLLNGFSMWRQNLFVNKLSMACHYFRRQYVANKQGDMVKRCFGSAEPLSIARNLVFREMPAI
jgi:hypothetical protein